MLEFLLFGGFWFWITFGACSILLLWNVIFSEHLLGIWFFGIILIVLSFLSGSINPSWIIENPWQSLMYFGIYIGIGILWSFKEWFSFVKEKAMEIKKASYRNKSETANEMRQRLTYELKLDEYWPDITSWIIFFPYYFIGWALTDPIKKIAKQFSFIYNKITKSVINKATAE